MNKMKRIHAVGRCAARRWLAMLVLCCVAGLSAPASAASGHAVGRWAFDKLSRAHGMISKEQYAEAFELMGEMRKKRGLNDHEKALMWQTLAYIYSSQDKLEDAAKAFETCLALNALPDAAQRDTRYNLAQLFVALKEHKKAIGMLKAWMAEVEKPSPQAHYLLAVAYVQSKLYREALPHAQTAIAAVPKPSESWLQLLLALHFELKDMPSAEKVLKRLLARFPKKNYWIQLAGVYGELDREKDRLATMELAYRQGLLRSESELTSLAWQYLSQGMPYWGAKVVEKGFAEERLKKTAKSWTLLAESYLQARELDRAVEPLAQAGALAEDGEAFVRLAQLQIEREDWDGAIAALYKAEKKGQLKEPGYLYLLRGIAYYQPARYEAARKAFMQARGFEKTERSAKQWIAVVDGKLAASEQLGVTPAK